MKKILTKMRIPATITMAVLLALANQIFAASGSVAGDSSKAPSDAPPIRALLITGGFQHDYNEQTKILTTGISARANVQWTVFHDNGLPSFKNEVAPSVKAFYSNPKWSQGFDIVIYNEFFLMLNDTDLINQMLEPHRNGLPAVVIHGAIHSYINRNGTPTEWTRLVGVVSMHHPPPQNFTVNNTAPNNPIMSGIPSVWTLPVHEELYEILQVLPTAIPLAVVHDPKDTTKTHCAVWTNLYGDHKTRVFGTFLYHRNSMMKDSAYLDMITKGLLWAVDKLDDAHLKPAKQVMLDGSNPESTYKDQAPFHPHD